MTQAIRLIIELFQMELVPHDSRSSEAKSSHSRDWNWFRMPRLREA